MLRYPHPSYPTEQLQGTVPVEEQVCVRVTCSLKGGAGSKLVPIYTLMYGVSESYVEMYEYADPNDSE